MSPISYVGFGFWGVDSGLHFLNVCTCLGIAKLRRPTFFGDINIYAACLTFVCGVYSLSSLPQKIVLCHLWQSSPNNSCLCLTSKYDASLKIFRYRNSSDIRQTWSVKMGQTCYHRVNVRTLICAIRWNTLLKRPPLRFTQRLRSFAKQKDRHMFLHALRVF